MKVASASLLQLLLLVQHKFYGINGRPASGCAPAPQHSPLDPQCGQWQQGGSGIDVISLSIALQTCFQHLMSFLVMRMCQHYNAD